MRYFHNDINKILEYLSERRPVMFMYDVEGMMPPMEIKIEDIKNYFNETKSYFGASPTRYIYISADAVGQPKPLYDAVVDIEKGTDQSKFILAGYNDGGVFSVSGSQLPFQESADEASWWNALEPPAWKRLFSWLGRTF